MLGTYFKPLRRKVGVVTLVMACVFAAGWVRSYSEELVNGIEFPFYDNRYNLVVIPEGIVLGTLVLQGEENQPELVFDDFFEIPHWLIVVPLTLLSAWLLLSKVRQKQTESLTAEKP
jgi:hypothetical protein